MLSKYDDYPIHQTAAPLPQPATSDRNFYDRYWFNGYSHDGAFFFAAGLAVYPNRHVMDASFTVATGGRQHSFHGSRRAPDERGETRVGPFRVEVVEPMRMVRLVLDDNETGISCDIAFTARTVALEEPRSTRRSEGRLIMDTSRFTQFGTWRGTVRVAGRGIDLAADATYGTRDRSWGVRPVGEPEGGAPARSLPQLFWLWAPLHFDDMCTHAGVFENADGTTWQSSALVVPAHSSPETIPPETRPDATEMIALKHCIDWVEGTRRAARVTLELRPHKGEPHRISLEPIARMQLLGLGYLHPEWGHGLWKGEEVIAGEEWNLDDLDPLDFRHLHVQQVCRAMMGNRTGVGVLEQLVIGPHEPSGFHDLLDGWRRAS